ncbi:MAG: GGDEF domain-containing protein [Deltaproteobacteria bacterium]|nr:GGDEF domain-containing protein [Deltaproteobacteria bacterium]
MNVRRKTVVTVISKIGDRRPKADACLVVIYGQDLGSKFVLKPGEVIIGRSSQATLQIDHESVSRRHARVVLTDTGVLLNDLSSTNGTYVNDEPVQERALAHGDLIKVGRSILKYLSTDNIEVAYHEEIHRLTTIDGLTRCFNARALRESMVREVSRSARYRRPLSVLMFDIDGFSRINEEYGHLAGDAILAQLGKRLGRRVRREDILARTGGGEFALLTPEIAKDGAVQFAQRMLRIIGETAFGFDDVQIPVTLSVGVASMDEVPVADPESETSPGLRPLADAAADSAASNTFQHSLQQPFASHTTSEFSLVESSRSGEVADRFHSAAESLLGLGRQRLAQAKADGKGRVVG